MTRYITRMLLLAASISIAAPRQADAQLGGIIKKKVKEAVSKPEPPEKTDQPQPSAAKPVEKKNSDPTGFGSVIVEITQQNVDDFMRALQMEIDAQAVLKKEIARYGTRDEYEACKVRVAQSPEGKKTMDRMYNPPKGISGEDYIKLQTKVVEDMEALTKKGCPLDPSYWGPTRVGQSLDSIRTHVAESIGDGIDPQMFGVALERIERLCQYKGLVPGSTATAKPDASNSSPLKFAGEGKDIYWMYTPNEVSVVNAANCKRYYALASKLIK